MELELEMNWDLISQRDKDKPIATLTSKTKNHHGGLDEFKVVICSECIQKNSWLDGGLCLNSQIGTPSDPTILDWNKKLWTLSRLKDLKSFFKKKTKDRGSQGADPGGGKWIFFDNQNHHASAVLLLPERWASPTQKQKKSWYPNSCSDGSQVFIWQNSFQLVFLWFLEGLQGLSFRMIFQWVLLHNYKCINESANIFLQVSFHCNCFCRSRALSKW